MLKNSVAVFVTFVVTIVVSRIVVAIADKKGLVLALEPKVGGIKIHHFTYGLLLVVVSGYLSVVMRLESIWLAITFGAGLGLAFDELYVVLRILSKYWFVKDSGGEQYHAKPTYVLLVVSALLLASLALAFSK